MNAERLMQLAGVVQFILTIHWVRNRELRERYAIGWIIVASVLLLCAMFPDTIKRFADVWRLAYPTAVLFVSLVLVYVFSFFVTVSLTRHHRRNLKLVQELAILEHRLRTLEDSVAPQSAAFSRPASESLR